LPSQFSNTEPRARKKAGANSALVLLSSGL